MKEYEFTAKTVEEAIDEGLRTLGLTREEASVTVLEEGKKGGLFSKGIKARVLVGKKKTDGERAMVFLEGMFELLGVAATTELDETEEHTTINVISPNTYAVIGHRGEVLDALQVLAGAVANIGREEYKRVVVDCENYRAKREETLRRLACKLAEKAVRTGRKVSIEPMSPYERRIIHAALADSTEVRTVSEGKEPNRYIVVVPNNLRPGSDRPRGGKPRFGDKKSFGRDRDRKFDRDRKPYEKKNYGEEKGERDRRGYDRRDRDRFERPRATGLPRSKRQPYFGTFLGNSNDLKKNEGTEPKDGE